MTIKKTYNVGDVVWVYGVNRSDVKPTQGKVVKVVDLTDAGHSNGPHYIISIPTQIDPLLEIRTWENISQDEKGPVGSLRQLGNIESTLKFVGSIGFVFDDLPASDIDEEDNIDPAIIHAAIEKSRQVATMPPLNLKPEKPKRRYYKKKSKA
jgi:hypothetical protein